MRPLILFFVWFLSWKVLAQQNLVDSLHQQLRMHLDTDTITVRLYNQIAFNYYRINPDSTLFFAKQAHQTAKQINYTQGIADGLKNMGVGYYAKGNYHSALNYYREAISYYKKLQYAIGLANCMNNIGVIYNDYFLEHDKALLYFQEALVQYKKLGHEQRIGLIYGNLGESYLLKKQYDSATYFLNLSLATNEKFKNDNLQSLDLIYLSQTLFAQQQYALSEQRAQEALQIAQRINSQRVIAHSLLQLGSIYAATKRIKESEESLLKALQIAQKLATKDIIRDVSYELYKTYRQMGKQEEALRYHVLHMETKDSIYLVEKTKVLKDLDYEYQLQSKEQQITLLEKDRKLRQEQQAKERLLMGLLGTTIVMLGILAFIFFTDKQKEAKLNNLLLLKNTEIEQQKEELLTQAHKLGETNQLKDKLFSVIAHDLRSPFNTLKGMLVLLSLDSLSAEDLLMIRTEVNRQLISIESTLHNLLHWAKSQLMGEASQPEAIVVAEIVSENISLLYATALAKEIRLEAQIDRHLVVCADYQQLLTILRNLIANAIKFTSPQGSVTITACQDGHQVSIAVRDTGIGMTPDQLNNLFGLRTHFSLRGTQGEKGTGLGLLLCKEFIEKNNGTISVVSKEKEGSIFTIALPSASATQGVLV